MSTEEKTLPKQEIEDTLVLRAAEHILKQIYAKNPKLGAEFSKEGAVFLLNVMSLASKEAKKGHCKNCTAMDVLRACDPILISDDYKTIYLSLEYNLKVKAAEAAQLLFSNEQLATGVANKFIDERVRTRKALIAVFIDSSVSSEEIERAYDKEAETLHKDLQSLLGIVRSFKSIDTSDVPAAIRKKR